MQNLSVLSVRSNNISGARFICFYDVYDVHVRSVHVLNYNVSTCARTMTAWQAVFPQSTAPSATSHRFPWGPMH